jgi:2',3'-cyclic-nucleotide 2'-phosphodiesterase (5'-nucleotidase family)
VPLTVPPRRVRRGHLAIVLLAMAGLLIPAAVFAARPSAPDPVNVQILNVSDWHGNIDPPGGPGGAWNISARWAADRAAFDGETLTVMAGDDVGATPPLASFFGDFPAVKTQRLMGVNVGTFGNHNFDSGIEHAQDIIDEAMAPSTGASGDHPGQPYRYVAANLRNLSENLTGVDPYRMFNLGGAKVAVIGIVNEEAPTLVAPGSFGTIQITDGAEAANKFATIARKAGANAVIVITHKGVEVDNTAVGPLIDFVNGLTPGLVDVVIGDHTNFNFLDTVNGVLVHENPSFGAKYTKTSLVVQPGRGGGVLSKSAIQVTPTVTGALANNNSSCTGAVITNPSPPPATLPNEPAFCDQDILNMLIPYRADLAVALDPELGTTTQVMDRGGNIERRQETPLGDLIADAMRVRMSTDFGYMNSGGIRSQFPACGYQPIDHTLNRSAWNSSHTTVAPCSGYAGGTPYDLVKGDVYTVLPFGNNTIRRTVTGAQLWEMLEHSVSQCPTVMTGTPTCNGRFPQISGFKFTFTTNVPTSCSGATPSTYHCSTPARILSVHTTAGAAIPRDGTVYTMATVDFMLVGGDGYFFMADGVTPSAFEKDTVVLLDYVTDNLAGAVDPAGFTSGRITLNNAP